MSETTLHTRRQFLRSSTLGVAAAWTLPAFLERTMFEMHATAAELSTQAALGKDHPILVVLQLAGGNDGLNTVIPYADDLYHKARPTLGFKKEQVLRIDDYCGFNKNLTGFKSLLDAGNLAVVQAVGYPNPNRSHFRSTDIWQTASDADKVLSHGWIGRYFDNCCEGADATVGVAIGGSAPLAFTAKTPKGISFTDPDRYQWAGEGEGEMMFRELNDDSEGDEGAGGSVGAISGGMAAGAVSSADFLSRTALDAQVSSDQVREIARKYRSKVSYPGGRLAADLSLVGRMIAGGMSSRVYYVSQGGYDTHNGQAGAHDRLMKDLNDALTAFCADLRDQGNFQRVTIMTFSEFGRRVQQNGSGGTDHGAAAPMFLIGGGIKAGLHGKAPSLSDLIRGDLKYQIDFRSVYASVLEDWMKVKSGPILGRQWSRPPLFG